MPHATPPNRPRRGLLALTAAAVSATAALGLAASPAAAGTPPAETAAAGAELGGACTAADLGTRHAFVRSTEVAPTITHFKGWYVTDGSLGSQTVETSTQTVIEVSVGQNTSLNAGFDVEALSEAGASVGLDVQMKSTSTGTTSKKITWDFQKPGYYGLYQGTKKVTGTYGSLNCNRVDLGDGTWGLRWVEAADRGSYTTYTTLEEGAVRCEDAVPADSIMRRAQDLLDCAPAATGTRRTPAAKEPTAKEPAAKEPAAKEPAAKVTEDRTDRTAGTRAALTCAEGFYKIGTPDKSLFWTAPPLLQGDTVQLKPSTIFSLNLDQWQMCDASEENGIVERVFVNRSSDKCLAVTERTAGDEGAALVQADCRTDDLQRFHVYRDVPGSDRIGVQNKHTGYMAGHDRHAENQPVRQYSSGRQDGSGTYVLVKA
ncbi:hypothetical protein [Streptomyces diastaticus]|uniref:hypothetical protein n=1 Tax=Streptomyces diastaticus TaxID=1956 RepID=UPI00368C05C0